MCSVTKLNNNLFFWDTGKEVGGGIGGKKRKGVEREDLSSKFKCTQSEVCV